jgi:deoxyribonuclease V
MHIRHPWNLPPNEAQQLQRELYPRLDLHWESNREIKFVGGADVAYDDQQACATIVVFTFPEMTLEDTYTIRCEVVYPYIPGLLAFREAPMIVEAFERIREQPDVLFLDGNGIAHPRGLGLASHIGLLLDLPTIGVAKSKFYGDYSQPGEQKGLWTPIMDEKEEEKIIGASLRTSTKIKPVYVSPGNRIDLEHAIQITLDCCRGFRLPEPLRIAHQMATQCIKRVCPA